MTTSSNYGRSNFNPKRRIRKPEDLPDLHDLAQRVQYDGHPGHKRKRGNFGVGARPYGDRTLCDAVGIFKKEEALRLLQEGVKRGLVSVQERGGFPQNIWAVSDDGHPLEAQQGSPGRGIYHGYPMTSHDTFRDKVIEHWEIE
jgi:hypothetical protein